MEECFIDLGDLKKIFDEVIESRRDLLNGAIDRIMAAIQLMPCAQENLHAVEVAIAEALANAVIHGNREDPEKRVRISVACSRDEQLLIAVTDEGEGFDQALVPDPTIADNIFLSHGRGIFLIRTLMDETEHRLGGRQILMRKRVAASQEQGGSSGS